MIRPPFKNDQLIDRYAWTAISQLHFSHLSLSFRIFAKTSGLSFFLRFRVETKVVTVFVSSLSFFFWSCPVDRLHKKASPLHISSDRLLSSTTSSFEDFLFLIQAPAFLFCLEETSFAIFPLSRLFQSNLTQFGRKICCNCFSLELSLAVARPVASTWKFNLLAQSCVTKKRIGANK